MKPCSKILLFLLIMLTFLCHFNYGLDVNNYNQINNVITIDEVKPNKSLLEDNSFTDNILIRYYLEIFKERTKPELHLLQFSEFKKYFYESNYDIREFTNLWLFNYDETLSHFEKGTKNKLIKKSSGSSNDHKYLLFSGEGVELNELQINENGSCFYNNKPVYNNNFDYANIKNGDIIFEQDFLYGIGHMALVYDVNATYLDENNNEQTFILTIEATGDSVYYGFLDDNRIIEKAVHILRAKNTLTDQEIYNLRYFTSEQIGDDYLYVPGRENTSIDDDAWYCSELIYAAYMYIGYDIKGTNSIGGLFPMFLYLYGNLSDTFISSRFIIIQVFNLINNKWFIRVFNTNNFDITIKYNSKLCFTSDAREFKNLNDIVCVNFQRYTYFDIQISNNGTADAIACCWIDEANSRHYNEVPSYVPYYDSKYTELQNKSDFMPHVNNRDVLYQYLPKYYISYVNCMLDNNGYYRTYYNVNYGDR